MYPTCLSGWYTSFRPNTNFSDFRDRSSNGAQYELPQDGDLEFGGGRGLLQTTRSAVRRADAGPGWGLRATSAYGNRQLGVPADSVFLWYAASAVLTVLDARSPTERPFRSVGL